MNNNNYYNNNQEENKKKVDFQYKLKLRTAIIGFILYLLLSTNTSFKILNLILKSIFSYNYIEIINEKNEISFIAKFIMAVIIFIILFIF